MIKAEKDSDWNIHLHPDENEELIAIHGDLDDVEAVVRKHYPDAVFSEPDEIGGREVCGYMGAFWKNQAARDADPLTQEGFFDCGA